MYLHQNIEDRLLVILKKFTHLQFMRDVQNKRCKGFMRGASMRDICLPLSDISLSLYIYIYIYVCIFTFHYLLFIYLYIYIYMHI